MRKLGPARLALLAAAVFAGAAAWAQTLPSDISPSNLQGAPRATPTGASEASSAATAKALERWEGTFGGSGIVVVIKAYPSHLLLNGKDSASAWTAHCVLRGAGALCRGTGHTTKGLGFAYESSLALPGDVLRDEWLAHHTEDQALKGVDNLRRLRTP